MSKPTTFYYPISQFSTNPLGDAAAQIAQVTGHLPTDILTAFAANNNAAVTAWNDPRLSVVALGGGVNGGVGTGRWQWLACYRIEDTTAQEVELHCAFSKGRNVITVGGDFQAPPPSFANMNLLTSPVLRSGMGGGNNSGGGANFLTHGMAPTNPATVLADASGFLRAEAASGGGSFMYYSDPVIDLLHGSGIWKIYCDAGMAAGTGPLCIVETGGCDLSSVGAALATPRPAFGQWTQIHSLWS